ncbi:hypothetical protein D9M73_254910 [compost metagenome]
MNRQALPKHRCAIKQGAPGLSRRHILFEHTQQHRINGVGNVLFQVGHVHRDLHVQRFQPPDVRGTRPIIDGRIVCRLGRQGQGFSDVTLIAGTEIELTTERCEFFSGDFSS